MLRKKQNCLKLFRSKLRMPQSDVQTTFVELPAPKFSASVQETEWRRVFMAKELGRSPSDHPGTVPASDGGLWRDR